MPFLSRMSLTLPPAENAVPAPVRISTFTDSSARTRAQQFTSSSHCACVESALRSSGRLRVSVTMAPSRSNSTKSVMGVSKLHHRGHGAPDGAGFECGVAQLLGATQLAAAQQLQVIAPAQKVEAMGVQGVFLGDADGAVHLVADVVDHVHAATDDNSRGVQQCGHTRDKNAFARRAGEREVRNRAECCDFLRG